MSDPTDPALIHREMAIASHNRSWTLIDADTRDADADAELLASAFASWWHWHQVGTAENKALADHQVAKVLALVGDGEPSLRYARRAMAAAEREGWTDWKLVACHEGMARAYACVEDEEGREHHLRAAAALLPELDGEDVAVLEPQLAEIPGWPPA
ncbi:MAG TPA: hypothetical protein VMY34_10250 [Acidimicrobiales bacterium]|nr:hypothetical protein [Acidimicrobiales bacterium]